MSITGRDVFVEINKAKEAVNDEKVTLVILGKVIINILQAIAKVVLQNRSNTVKLMKKFEVPLDEPKKDEEKKEDTTA